MQNKDTVYFISDAHFGIKLDKHNEREKHFFRFLEKTADSMSELYIIGDLFDFWIEYKHAIRPEYFNILHHLKIAVDRGVKIHYLAGNHDFALGTFLTDQAGISIYDAHIDTTIQGKKVHLFHGDGLLKKDVGYRILKKILRNKTNLSLYQLLHPDFGIWLATLSSGSSRKHQDNFRTPEFCTWVRQEYREHARHYLASGSDIVIFGHSHLGELIRFPNGIYCNTGAWLTHFNFATMKEGTLKFWTYPPSSNAPQEIQPIESK